MASHEPGDGYRFAETLAAIDPLQRGTRWWLERSKAADDPTEYLAQRLKSTAERVAWVNDLRGAQRRGIDRFVGEGYDRQLDVVREQRAAKGGLDGNDEAELGWAPRGERKKEND